MYFVMSKPVNEVKSLAKIVAEKPQGWSKIHFLNWALEMAKTVGYLHNELHVLQRDLGPDAWFIDGEKLILVDFGKATLLKDGEE